MKNTLIVVLVILLVGAAAAAVIHFAGPSIASELVKTETTYTVTGKITNGELSEKSLKVADGAAAMVKIEPAEGYDYPATIEVAGITDSKWDYNPSTGLVSLLKVSDDVVITATCPVAVRTVSVTGDIMFGSLEENSIRIGSGEQVHILPDPGYGPAQSLTVTGARVVSISEFGTVSLADITGDVTISGSCFFAPRSWMDYADYYEFAVPGDKLKFNTSVPRDYLLHFFGSLDYDDAGCYALIWGESVDGSFFNDDVDSFGLLVAIHVGDEYLLVVPHDKENQSDYGYTVVWSSAAGSLHGVSYIAGWQNLDAMDSVEISGFEGMLYLEADDTCPEMWHSSWVGYYNTGRLMTAIVSNDQVSGVKFNTELGDDSIEAILDTYHYVSVYNGMYYRAEMMYDATNDYCLIEARKLQINNKEIKAIFVNVTDSDRGGTLIWASEAFVFEIGEGDNGIRIIGSAGFQNLTDGVILFDDAPITLGALGTTGNEWWNGYILGKMDANTDDPNGDNNNDPDDPNGDDNNGDDPDDPNGDNNNDPDDPNGDDNNGDDPDDPNGDDPDDPNGDDPNGDDPDDPNGDDEYDPWNDPDYDWENDPLGLNSQNAGTEEDPDIGNE